MARGANQKLKLLYLARIFVEQTDENHGLEMKDILEKLGDYEIEAERKSIYNDIRSLVEYGYDIRKKKEKNKVYYYLATHEFDMAELRFLVDVLQSSRFLTEGKTEELIKILEHNVSKYDVRLLKKSIIVPGRIKSMNDSVFANVDVIHMAMDGEKEISFKYFHWNEKAEKVFLHEGKCYEVSPWGLIYDNENYYLLAFDGEEDKFKHFRVDKMVDVKLLKNKKRIGREEYHRLDIDNYKNRIFNMFDGDERLITLEFTEKMTNVIIDKFGKDVRITKKDDMYEMKINLAVSPQFFGWVFGLHGDVRITGPEDVSNHYKDMLKKQAEEY